MNCSENKCSEIADNYSNYFKTLVADNDVIKEEVFKIRHKVYCEELSYEPERLDEMEQDEFDSQSTFSIIQHKTSGLFAGCIRVVGIHEDNQLLPFEKHFSNSFNHATIHPSKFERESMCEISRLAILDKFRYVRPNCNDNMEQTVAKAIYFSEAEKKYFAYIAIGLYMSACVVTLEIGKKNAFIVAEPRLIRNMNLYGIRFEQISNFIDFHGQRALFYLNTETFEQGLKPAYRELYSHIEKEIENQFLKKTNSISN